MANWFVDNTNTPPGTGTSLDPYSSIQNAFNNAALAAGDHIKIRTGTGIYDANNKPPAGRNGAAGNPIIVEPDTANTPVLRYTGSGAQAAAIQLEDVNYWTVQNLTFDGAGVYTSKFAIWIRANLVNITGNTITGCTIQNWGGTTANNISGAAAIEITGRATASFFPTLSTVSNNTITTCRRAGVEVAHKATFTTISGNTISAIQEGREAGSSTINMVGIFLSNDCTNFTVTDNVVHDHEPWANTVLTSQGNAVWAGLWADAGAATGTCTGNTFYNIGQGKGDTSNSKGTSWQGIGIFIESRCHNWTVSENVVYNIGTYGLRNSSEGISAADNTQWLNNSIFNVCPAGVIGIGFILNNGHNITFEDNIIYGATKSQIQVITLATGQGPHTINYNDYWDSSGGNKVGQWGASGVLTFSQWKSTSGTDVQSINADPLFVSTTGGSEDLHLQNGSPCIGTGLGGTIMGAYPDQSFTIPIITNVTASAITFNSFLVTWTTDLPSSSQVEYGTTISYGTASVNDATMVTNHSVLIIGLTSYTLYHYRVKSQATGGPVQNSADFTIVSTLPAPTSVVAS